MLAFAMILSGSKRARCDTFTPGVLGIMHWRIVTRLQPPREQWSKIRAIMIRSTVWRSNTLVATKATSTEGLLYARGLVTSINQAATALSPNYAAAFAKTKLTHYFADTLIRCIEVPLGSKADQLTNSRSFTSRTEADGKDPSRVRSLT